MPTAPPPDERAQFGRRFQLAAPLVGVLVVAAGLAGASLFGLGFRYWAVPVSGCAFSVTQLLFPGSRASPSRLLGPLNWLILAFFFQLVALPHLIQWWGAAPGLLPRLPETERINDVLLLNSLAFFVFSFAVHLGLKRGAKRPLLSRPPTRVTAVVWICLGLLAMAIDFSAPGGFLAALSDPMQMANVQAERQGTIAAAIVAFFRPVFAFGVVAMWGRWMDQGGREAAAWRRIIVTSATALAVFMGGLSLGLNRASFVVPAVAVTAAYFRSRPRPGMAGVFAAGAILIIPAVLVGAYRSAQLDALTFLHQNGRDSLAQYASDTSELVQVYAMAPQFPAYFIEEAEHRLGDVPPSMLLSSALAPIPVLGKEFRDNSGTAIYNRLVYGSIDAADQIAPFLAEALLAGGIAAVIVSCFAIGWFTARLQYAFDVTNSTFVAYALQFIAIWVAFLVVGSLSAFSQVVVYSMWPLYMFAVGRAFRRFADKVIRGGVAPRWRVSP